MTSNISFRARAREAIERAKAELNSLQPHRLRYVALELRFAMEALTYERAQNYKDDLPSDELRTWQPRKLLQALLEINPDADQSLTLKIRPESSTGEPSRGQVFQGREEVLGLHAIKRHYDALGSFLHMPTLNQIEGGADQNTASLQSRCEELLKLIEAALTSSVFNVRFGNQMTFECQRCAFEIKRYLPLGDFSIETACQNCGAKYLIKDAKPGRAAYMPVMDEHVCPSCSATFRLWTDEFEPGLKIQCPFCGKDLLVVVGIVEDPTLRDQGPVSP